ncbi:winged helix-turn-helix domain-containing protein [Bacillus marinisedimentorum]|uniref:winged helix-turn-helix domain-containing protein n=1 Tax=Bacillus marinisedimentorum TaxID=1821260 RepID=UPI0008732B61|nr:helix-turn-helix domain-containing protein [Bacillus marinisedimentorum]
MTNPAIYIDNADNDFLDAILHDGGMEVLSVLSVASLTATEVARQVSVPLAKVNYIIKILERNELVYADSTKSKEDIVETAYKADVNSFGIRLSNRNSNEMEKIKLITYMIEEVRTGMRNAVSGNSPAEFSLVKARIPKERVKEYIHMLRELEDDIDSHQENNDDPYTFAVSLFPNFKTERVKK